MLVSVIQAADSVAPTIHALWLIFAFIAGSAIGSGLMCLVMRKARKEPWSKGRSHCESCGHVLKVRDLIPIISYYANHGKCRYCGTEIGKKCVHAEIYGGVWALTISTVWVSSFPLWFKIIGSVVFSFMYYIYFVGEYNECCEQYETEQKGTKDNG